MAKVYNGHSFSIDQNFNLTSVDEWILGTHRVNESVNGEFLRFNSIDDDTNKSFVEKAFRGEVGSHPPKSNSVIQDFQWEYVIVFPNPDFKVDENRKITKKEALEYYKNCFRGKKTGSIQKDRILFSQEIESFESAFSSLSTLEDGKRWSNGGRMAFVDDKIVDHSSSANDFLTLMRNAVFYKLVASLSLKVKQMVSKSGEHIFFVITADQSDLIIEAQRVRFNKQLEIALTDIQSLLPCDLNLRPFHLLETDDNEINSIYKEIEPFMLKALGIDKNIEKTVQKHEPFGVTVPMWKAYKSYLFMLKDGIFKITSSLSSNKNQMFLFHKLIKDSIEKSNLGLLEKDKLKNLWDHLSIPKPIAPYAEFRFSNEDDEFADMWRTHEINELGKRCLFRSMERIRLIASYIETEIGINFLQQKGVIEAHFPLQDIWQLKGKNSSAKADVNEDDLVLKNLLFDFRTNDVNGPLIRSWNTALINQKIPLNKIRNYFGEKIALYFEFLRYFQVSLLVPGIVGLVVFIIQKIYDDQDPIVLSLNAIYSVFITIWATVYLEGWKRKESSLSIIWGTSKYERVEVPRPQYQGVKRRSPITDEMEEIYFPPGKRVKFIIFAASVSLLILSLVLGIVAGLIVLKWQITKDLIVGGFNLAGPVISILNAVQIVAFNIIYEKLAKVLTDMENHKTENQYQDSFILKVFAFQFVNAFNSLCYIAFIKGYTEGCIATDSSGEAYKTSYCMSELQIQLISIFIVNYIKNLVEVGQPYIKFQLRKRRKMKNKHAKVTNESKDLRDKIETQLCLDYYMTTDSDGTIEDYMELAVLFGYLTLFAMAFPLSSLLAYIGLWFEMHTDKLKLLHLVRRPIPLSTKDIGTWLNIFSVLCVFGIFSNTALFCFTSKTFDGIGGGQYNYIIFAVVVAVLLIFKNQLESWIPDVPGEYETIRARHEYIVEKVLRGEVNEVIEVDEEVYDAGMYFVNAVDIDKRLTEIR